ncbi:MAG: NUDIX domain-containing protein [Phycisphaerae bacterium]|nr:MAG: NUDIX domain-containing protein [Phycisphaerae bacterium]MBE7457109.1 NUDIX domain-containing protein [Planctomycetia bacterium]MCK6463532.1 NUDIX domain-containing protein [Phycisphaerae bacterium]MCL4719014.1 NUDIX domain-containing protein [Phycisphaerae bacterium]NUQ07802.1 NUDIX domain-containing protein [Phycisphaerae bacterium]
MTTVINASAGAACRAAARGIRRGVIGILHEQGRYLLIRRAPGVTLGGTWCFPGGHIERGENARRAVVRELHEELGIVVLPHRRLGAVAGRPDVILAIWIVERVGGAWKPNEAEIADLAWLNADEIRRHPLGLPSNLPVVDRLEQWRASVAGDRTPS